MYIEKIDIEEGDDRTNAYSQNQAPGCFSELRVKMAGGARLAVLVVRTTIKGWGGIPKSHFVTGIKSSC